jgi:hypothetical protein
MKTLNRLFLVVLAAALVGAVYAMHTNATQFTLGHATYFALKYPWLKEVREVTLFALLAWCLLFVKREPTFVRLGLVALIVACALMYLPPHEVDGSFLHLPWH